MLRFELGRWCFQWVCSGVKEGRGIWKVDDLVFKKFLQKEKKS